MEELRSILNRDFPIGVASGSALRMYDVAEQQLTALLIYTRITIEKKPKHFTYETADLYLAERSR